MKNLHRKLKVVDSNGKVKINQLKDDIKQRKEMLKILNNESRGMTEMLVNVRKYKDKAVTDLKNYSSRYQNMIWVHIVLIQRWFRGVRQRMFFKSLLRRDL